MLFLPGLQVTEFKILVTAVYRFKNGLTTGYEKSITPLSYSYDIAMEIVQNLLRSRELQVVQQYGVCSEVLRRLADKHAQDVASGKDVKYPTKKQYLLQTLREQIKWQVSLLYAIY